MAESLEQQLERVQTAIAKIESGGQDVTYNGRRITYGSLDQLYIREQSLLRRIERQNRGGIRSRDGIPV